MKKYVLLFIICITSFGLMSFTNSKNIDPAIIISKNIAKFNEEVIGGKEETSFSKTQYIVPVYDINKKYIGTLITFDNNDGYIMISKENVVFKKDYKNGFPIDLLNHQMGIILHDNVYYSMKQEVLWEELTRIYGKGVNFNDDIFKWHADSKFNSKTRNFLFELDAPYSTLTNTSSTTWENWDTHSTYQGPYNTCGPVALANLLWTYKIRGIDLTQGASSSSDLVEIIKPYVNYSDNYGTNPINMTGINNFLLGTGYKLTKINVVNGIQDDLYHGPVIGLYSSAKVWETAHYALVTGKGKSLYKRILGISFYTSWDVVNTWYNVNSNGYPRYKYWVDNQYIWSGWQLTIDNN